MPTKSVEANCLGLWKRQSPLAIGRVHAIGPDATALTEGRLILYNFFIVARDNEDIKILQGYMGRGPIAVGLEKTWSDGTYARFSRVPLENCLPLNEELLTRQLGYTFADIVSTGMAIPHAGVQEIGAQPGDNIIVAPTTGYFGSCAVQVALALGASVIAVGRNEKTLSEMVSTYQSTGRLKVVKLSGDVQTGSAALLEASASPKGADKYVDFSPPQSSGSTHIESCLLSLRPLGKCVLMGAVFSKVGIPDATIMQKSLTLQGRFMFESHHVQATIKLVEAGMLRMSSGAGSGTRLQRFNLEDIENALDRAETDSGWGRMVIVEPPMQDARKITH